MRPIERTPLTYPMTSDRYAVQYRLGSGDWTDAKVYISYYGGTNASPYRSSSGYAPDTSMSFASIPASASTAVALRVTKLLGSAFPAINHVSVRPRAKGIHVDSVSGNTVQISTSTAADFAGDQFLLWWDGDTQQSSSIQGLAFFLNPPYAKPTGSNVKVVAAPADLTGDLSLFDTLDFEGTVAVGSTGAQAFVVPANIRNIFLAPGAWVQGKLRFEQNGQGNLRRIYGPGVLDVSRFEYDLRTCGDNSGLCGPGLPRPFVGGSSQELGSRHIRPGWNCDHRPQSRHGRPSGQQLREQREFHRLERSQWRIQDRRKHQSVQPVYSRR